jgi:inositol transport system ATP-binding protein
MPDDAGPGDGAGCKSGGRASLLKDYILQLKGITKEFPGVKALDNMQFFLKRGSIHALIGENGAGKSTLMKVLSGVYTPDTGQIILDGIPERIANPIDAERKGISIVYQELSVFPTTTVSENVFTTNPPKNKAGFINYRKMHKEVRKLLDTYGFTDIDEKATIRNLSVGRQQIIEILRAVKQNAKVLILDEPTSALTERETEVLMEIMRTLNKEGVSIIYISHRLEEIFQICDTVTIMRDGQYIKTLAVENTSKDELVKYMVGRDVVYQYGAGSNEIGEELLRVENLTYKKEVKNVSFSLHRGEVLGLAGLEGAGRTEVLECLFGICHAQEGKIFLEGEEIRISSPEAAKANGLAYLTKDRKNKGLYLRMSIADNVLAANVDRFTRKGLMQFQAARSSAMEYREKFQIKTPDVDKKVSQLSGGNQQKVLLSMWISRKPQILLIDEPTRGIDVGTKEAIHRLIRDFAKQGMGVIMVSSDMPELIGASDRIVSMYEGRISGQLKLEQITEERIMAQTSGLTIDTKESET